MEKNLCRFDEDFIRNYDEDSNKGYILEVDVKYQKKIVNLQSDLPFLIEKMKIENSISLFAICMKKKNMLLI